MDSTVFSDLKYLKEIDWTFFKHSSNGHLTSLHPYPARFIPIIPRTILEVYKTKGLKRILDPFAGCGTTLVEGLNLGYEVFGIDINSIAILLERVYSYPYTKADLDNFEKLSCEIIMATKDAKACEYIDIPNLKHWFNEDAIKVLSISINKLTSSKYEEQIKDLVRFSISRVIVKISNQESDTQYRAVRKDLDYKKIGEIISASYAAVSKKFHENLGIVKNKSTIIQGDARDTRTYIGIKDIDLIITSPPYPNAYEYWLYHKYRMYWLGMDPIWCRSSEIGARPFYSGSGKMDENNFYEDMLKVFENLQKVTTNNAMQFWIVGDSIIKGKLIDNSQIITEACIKTGWNVKEKIRRDLVRTKSSFQGIGRQKNEDLLIICKK